MPQLTVFIHTRYPWDLSSTLFDFYPATYRSLRIYGQLSVTRQVHCMSGGGASVGSHSRETPRQDCHDKMYYTVLQKSLPYRMHIHQFHNSFMSITHHGARDFAPG